MHFSNIKKIVLVVSLVIVLNLFFNLGIKAFYNEPKNEDFCKNINYHTQNDCEAAGGAWLQNGTVVEPRKGVPVPAPVITTPDNVNFFCDLSVYYDKCSREYTAVREVYDRNVFIVLTVLGILSIIGGMFFRASEAISIGFSFGGVVSLIIGAVRYWSSMQDFLRFAVAGVALVVLVWLGIKKFGEKQEENKNAGV